MNMLAKATAGLINLLDNASGNALQNVLIQLSAQSVLFGSPSGRSV
jgi:hypothetical protein